MPTLIKYATLRVGLLHRDHATDLVTLNPDGTIAYYLATIVANEIELHGGFPTTFDHQPTDCSDSPVIE